MEISNPTLKEKKGVERYLKLVTVYEDPDYHACTVSGLASQNIMMFAILSIHLNPSVLSDPCSLVARHEDKIVGICLCTDKESKTWQMLWDDLKTQIPKSIFQFSLFVWMEVIFRSKVKVNTCLIRGYDEKILIVLQNYSEVDELKENNVTEWKQNRGWRCSQFSLPGMKRSILLVLR